MANILATLAALPTCATLAAAKAAIDRAGLTKAATGMRKADMALHLVAIAATRKRRRKQRKPLPTVREWITARRERAAENVIFDRHLLPRAKDGAGEIVLRVRFAAVTRADAMAQQTRGDQSTVARAYKYPVWDHIVTVTAPRTCAVVSVDGVVTIARPADLRRQAAEPVQCAWLTRGRGYSLQVHHGWLYRGVHVTAPSAAAARARVEKAQAGRAKPKNRDWITVRDLRAIGACAAGIAAAKREAEMMLGAAGPVGAVAADWAAAQNPMWARYVRAVRAA